jgi:hypothetical protein
MKIELWGGYWDGHPVTVPDGETPPRQICAAVPTPLRYVPGEPVPEFSPAAQIDLYLLTRRSDGRLAYRYHGQQG